MTTNKSHTEQTVTRHDPRYVQQYDAAAKLIAWAGQDKESLNMNMGGWADTDESPFRTAIVGELTYGLSDAQTASDAVILIERKGEALRFECVSLIA